MSSPGPLPYREEFEKHGETMVRFKFAGKPGEIGRSADVWLEEQRILREEAASAKRDAREEATLKLAKRANRIAWIAATSATIAAITAIIAAIISVIKSP